MKKMFTMLIMAICAVCITIPTAAKKNVVEKTTLKANYVVSNWLITSPPDIQTVTVKKVEVTGALIKTADQFFKKDDVGNSTGDQVSAANVSNNTTSKASNQVNDTGQQNLNGVNISDETANNTSIADTKVPTVVTRE